VADRGEILRLALPTIARLRTYTPGMARDDLVAGLALTAVLVPVGMGYAEAAGLPPVVGLYASIGALVAYFLVGPSRVLVFGPDSSLVPLVAAALLPLAAGDPQRATALAGALAMMAGALCIGAAVARLGFVTDLLSGPIRIGYMNGIALTIAVGQLPKLLGFSVDSASVLGGLAGTARGIQAGLVVPAATAIGVLCLVVILVGRRIAPRFPSVLLAVVLGAVLVVVLGLQATIAVVGDVPQALPPVGLPAVSLADLVDLFPTAIALALISFADTSVISHAFAARRGEHVNPDHELAALGVVNVAAGLVSGFPASGSATRTPVAEQAGAKTQVTGLVGAACIVLLLVVVPRLLSPVPSTALAAVVLAAAISLVDAPGLRHLWRVRRSELGVAVVAFLAVVLFGALPGILIAVGLSLVVFIRRAWVPYDAVLGRVAGYKGYHDVSRHPDARFVPGLMLYRWDAPLFFANAPTFRERVLAEVDAAEETPRWLAIAAEPITDVDTTAADMLDELITDLARRGTALHFAELKGPVKDRLARYGIYERLGAGHFHPTVGSVVSTFLARYPDIEWHDWEDDARPPEADADAGENAVVAHPDEPDAEHRDAGVDRIPAADGADHGTAGVPEAREDGSAASS
jgi:high affinity sulfate transporter 1